jgi:cell division protein FtsB
MRLIIVVLVILLVVLQYKLWQGDGNMFEVWDLQKALEAQRQTNQRLQSRNRALEAEVADLKTGLKAVEERARLELGMIKQGETFYQIVESQQLDGNIRE